MWKSNHLLLLSVWVLWVNADVYMHNPRGSNDRNCERNANRDNGNRVFDSQNNNAGGYACPRAVGDEDMQNEMGNYYFTHFEDDENVDTKLQKKRMYYYEGSILPIEWTDQHGCGVNSKVSCEIVLQYACEDTLDPMVDDFWPWFPLKDGTDGRGQQKFRSNNDIAAPRDGIPRDSLDAATTTIPDSEANAIPNSVENRRFGMHENRDFYQSCQYTSRNKGLYTADQNIRRNDQRGTRQNPNGNRNGFECPEERDYYPWWHPSPWIDIAVLTDSAWDTPCYNTSQTCSARCHYYMNNTMNWNDKGYCDVNHEVNQPVTEKTLSSKWVVNQWYNNRRECEDNGFKWYMVNHGQNLGALNFTCAKTQFSRTNQLGNAEADNVFSQNFKGISSTAKSETPHGVNANRFLWEIPNIPDAPSTYFSDMEKAYKSCTLRIRYNISSADLQQWPDEANGDDVTEPMVDHSQSSAVDLNIVPLTQDPYVYIAPEGATENAEAEGTPEIFLSLAINTNQYSRTFQDRSFSFTIKKLPTADDTSSATDVHYTDTPQYDYAGMRDRLAAGGKIINVNVRGKRGNIVQTFPSVEYDFVPNSLVLTKDDMIHWQWTGSDYNPRRGCNNGEGGPPDLNTYSTSANAGDASRADRSNVVFTNYMANNVPRDYLNHSRDDTTINDNTKVLLSKNAVAAFAPCTDGTTDVDHCYAQVLRLAFLGQHTDEASLDLRDQKACLTQDELDNILNSAERENHPLNCAKMNAKPFPYFDGGIMMMLRSGFFSFFSSRNNNFSNRQQIGVICVIGDGETCDLDPNSGVIQDENPMTNGKGAMTPTNQKHSVCIDEASDPDGANTNGARSCATTSTQGILSKETFNVQEGDNDKFGDGNKNDCPVLTVNQLFNAKDPETQLTLAFILLAVGMFFSWACYYAYNRCYGNKDANAEHRGQMSWQKEQGDSLIKDDFKTSVYSNASPRTGKPLKGAGAGGAGLTAGIAMTKNPTAEAFKPGRTSSPRKDTHSRVTLSSMKSASSSRGAQNSSRGAQKSGFASQYKDMI